MFELRKENAEKVRGKMKKRRNSTPLRKKRGKKGPAWNFLGSMMHKGSLRKEVEKGYLFTATLLEERDRRGKEKIEKNKREE